MSDGVFYPHESSCYPLEQSQPGTDSSTQYFSTSAPEHTIIIGVALLEIVSPIEIYVDKRRRMDESEEVS